ncbi:MAG: SCP2 sterol-binding domain-containing protein [Desulfarculus sp.]|nr:SCP2 sterol-binding domain-containing protein [Desulfarculus sp.]
MKLEDHPTAQKLRGQPRPAPSRPLPAGQIKALALAAGASAVGLVEIGRPELEPWRSDILEIFPQCQTLVSLAVGLNPANVRCPARNVSDLEFLRGGHAVDAAGQALAAALAPQGVAALVFPAGFPMDLSRWPGKMWAVSHKPVAVAAGLGHLGLNRLLLHPRLGGFLTLGTVLLDAPADRHDQPLEYNPCLDCKLCVAACPVGAIGADGHFAFSNCLTHNYRDRLGGFQDWVEQVAASRGGSDYRRRVPDRETVSMWQSLSYGICNKSSYCMAVCPAGEDQAGPFLADRAAYLARVLGPLRDKVEDIYVVPGSDAARHVARRFPHKRPRLVHNGLRPATARGFLDSLPLVFQPGQAQGLNATYHFTFSGQEQICATVTIQEGRLEVLEGHQGQADLHLKADSQTWVRFLAKEQGLLPALLGGKMKIKGPPRLMKAFAACFPG